MAHLVNQSTRFNFSLFRTHFAKSMGIFKVIMHKFASRLAIRRHFMTVALNTRRARVNLDNNRLNTHNFRLRTRVLQVGFHRKLVDLSPLTFLSRSSTSFTTGTRNRFQFVTYTSLTKVAFRNLDQELQLRRRNQSRTSLQRLLITTYQRWGDRTN